MTLKNQVDILHLMIMRHVVHRTLKVNHPSHSLQEAMIVISGQTLHEIQLAQINQSEENVLGLEGHIHKTAMPTLERSWKKLLNMVHLSNTQYS